MHQLHTETPLAKAIFELFGNFETAVRHVTGDLPTGSIRAFIFGGCALHIHTNARGSNDLDVELEAAQHLKTDEIRLELDPVYFEDENGLPSILELDTQFNTALASVSPDYKERAILLTGRGKPLHIYLVSAVDVAVSKLGRLASDDMLDIINLYQVGGFDLQLFESVAQDALDYYAIPKPLELNIEHALRELRKL